MNLQIDTLNGMDKLYSKRDKAIASGDREEYLEADYEIDKHAYSIIEKQRIVLLCPICKIFTMTTDNTHTHGLIEK